MTQDEFYAMCPMSLYLWLKILSTSNSCFICQQLKKLLRTVTDHRQPWPVWYSTPCMVPIGAQGTGCLSRLSNPAALHQQASKDVLIWQVPIAIYANRRSVHVLCLTVLCFEGAGRMENHGIDTRCLFTETVMNSSEGQELLIFSQELFKN